MLFNSIEFFIFLPLVFFVYWFIFGRSLKYQNLFIVGASYVFYGWWDWRFLAMICFTSLCSFVSGIAIEKRLLTNKYGAKSIMLANVCINLLILCVFKYYNFFISSFSDLLGLEGSSLLLDIILPVGISFYTFQALSYSIDVYRRTLKATHNPINLFAYVSFFPQLVAGPIERASNLLPQFEKKRTFNYAQAIDGCRQMLWGFFKKIVIADICATGVNNIFNSYETAGGMLLVIGAVLFTFQIYGDFSGYSDIAIGCSKLFGIDLMRNFNVPYFSRDIAEFWRRWHISLSTWFRDYIYIPLGGSRSPNKFLVLRNTFIIFLISGFWHGANWTFIVWGAYHALLFMPLMLLGKNRKNNNLIAVNKMLPSLTDFCKMLLTFTLVAVGWIIFRAETIEIAYSYIVGIFTTKWHNYLSVTDLVPLTDLRTLAYGLPVLIVLEWLTRNRKHGLDINTTYPILKHRACRWILYYIISIVVIMKLQEINTFIYFQF